MVSAHAGVEVEVRDGVGGVARENGDVGERQEGGVGFVVLEKRFIVEVEGGDGMPQRLPALGEKARGNGFVSWEKEGNARCTYQFL